MIKDRIIAILLSNIRNVLIEDELCGSDDPRITHKFHNEMVGYEDAANEIIELFKKVDEEILEPSFWFMCDGHLFIKPKGNSLDEIKKDLVRIAKENPYGMVCPVTLLDLEGKDKRRVGKPVHVDKYGKVDIKAWYDSVKDEPAIKDYKGDNQ